MVRNVALVVSAVNKGIGSQYLSVDVTVKLFTNEVGNKVDEDLHIHFSERVHLKVVFQLHFKVLFIQYHFLFLEVNVGIQLIGLDVNIII